jgi:hypothetical protein
MNVALQVVVSKVPSSFKEARNLVSKVWDVLVGDRTVTEDLEVKRIDLPEIAERALKVPLEFKDVEYVAWAAYIGIFEGVPKIREPKVILFKYPRKLEWERRKLRDNLIDRSVRMEKSASKQRGRSIATVRFYLASDNRATMTKLLLASLVEESAEKSNEDLRRRS